MGAAVFLIEVCGMLVYNKSSAILIIDYCTAKEKET